MTGKPGLRSQLNPSVLARSRLTQSRLTITIVGAGKLGSALARSLSQAGYVIDELIIRRGAGSVRKGRLLGKKVRASVVTLERSKLGAEVIWLCVPDCKIASVALSLSRRDAWRKKIVFHSSGLLTSDVLTELSRKGAAAASVHPLMTFVQNSNPPLAGVPFAIEGDAAAIRVARRIVKDLGGDAFPIRRQDKAAYHVWATFASPLLTALLATTEKVAATAGLSKKSVKQKMLPILGQTIANYANRNGASAFSGPIIRGDVDTVKQHLTVLHDIPAAHEVYVALARAALKYLPARNKNALARLLNS